MSISPTSTRRGLVLTAAACVIVGLVACSHTTPDRSIVIPGASPRIGQQLIEHRGCGSCHDIPGVKGADGLVGPPLLKFGRRGYIAGELANTPDNLVRWLLDPKAVEPGTDMPDLGLTQQQARNIAAYLEDLR
jgi:cytochrome c2